MSRTRHCPYIDESIVLDPYNAYAYRNKGIYYLKKNDAECNSHV
jgi:hypothetical protein